MGRRAIIRQVDDSMVIDSEPDGVGCTTHPELTAFGVAEWLYPHILILIRNKWLLNMRLTYMRQIRSHVIQLALS